MTGWKLNSPGVTTILGEVDQGATDLSAALTGESLQAILTGMNPTGVPALSEVPAMLQTLINDQEARLTAISNHVTAGRAAVANAQAAYDVGNLDMAAQLQTAAVNSAATGDFSWLTGGA